MRNERHPTKLGQLIIDRMGALGLDRQVQLADATAEAARHLWGAGAKGVSQSTVSRLIYYEDYIPDRNTLLMLAHAINVNPRWLVMFAFGLDGDEPATVERERMDPLARELNAMLQPGVLEPGQRERLRIATDVCMTGFRPLARH